MVTPEVFIGRFLMHVLPKGFVKIRHYGLMAAGIATTRLEVARTVLLAAAGQSTSPTPAATMPASPAPLPAPTPTSPADPAPAESADWQTQLKGLTGLDLRVCRLCGGVRILQPLHERSLQPSAGPAPVPQDTS